jgi:hypothetical protein
MYSKLLVIQNSHATGKKNSNKIYYCISYIRNRVVTCLYSHILMFPLPIQTDKAQFSSFYMLKICLVLCEDEGLHRGEHLDCYLLAYYNDDLVDGYHFEGRYSLYLQSTVWEQKEMPQKLNAGKSTGLVHCTLSQLYILLQADLFGLFMVYLTLLPTAKNIVYGYGIFAMGYYLSVVKWSVCKLLVGSPMQDRPNGKDYIRG